MLNNHRIALSTVFVALALAGCRPLVPVTNLSNVPYSTGGYQSARVLTLGDYERAIVRAGTNRGWRFSTVSSGLLEGNLDVRGKHSVVVEVPFTTDSYSINYKSSKGMKYDAASNQIHPNYDSWIKLLDDDIKKEIQRMQAS